MLKIVATTALLIGVGARVGAADCTPPTFQVVDAAVGPTGGTIRVVLSPGQFTRLSLVCTVTTILNANPELAEKSVLIGFFWNATAALRFNATGDRRDDIARRDSQQKAAFTIGPGDRRGRLVLMPAGAWGGRPYETVLDLASPVPAACRLQFDGRCVIGTDLILYPRAELTARREGRVAITAQVSEDGVVSDVQISGKSDRSRPATAFEQYALDVVRSWRFESSSTASRISATFVFALDHRVVADLPPDLDWYAAQRNGGYIDLDLGVANTIVVRATPITP